MSILAIALVAMAASIGAHLLACRRGLPHLTAYVASLIVGFMVTIGGLLLVVPHDATFLWSLPVALGLFGSWWFIFLNIVQAMESSLRIRILREIALAGGSLSTEALSARYSDSRLIGLRVSRLTESGAIRQRGDRLLVASRPLLFLARLFRLLKLMIIHRTSEFL